MKILHVIYSVDPKGGGPIEGIKQRTPILSALGHDVEVASLDNPSAPFLQAVPFTVHALGPAQSNYGYSPHLVPWLRANAGNYDVVIVNGLWQFNSLATWWALRGSKTPYYVFTHGMLDPWFKKTYPLKHLKKWLYWPWGLYPVLRDAKAVLFTSEEERILARQSFWLYRCNEVVISYGTADPKGDATQQRALFLKQFPALQGKRLFIFLSRIHEKKGCDLLIEAFAKVADTNPDCHLVMAGPDQTGWQKDLVALSKSLGIDNSITWTGMLAGDMKWGAYHAAEAFVLPSHQENFGIVVAEALACSLPVLISNKVNIWREIEQEKAGFVANDTLEGCSELLGRWLSHPKQEQGLMRQNARQCFLKHFEISKAAQDLVEVIQKK